MGYSKGCHTTFHHRYHIVWAPKYRFKVLHGEVRMRVREIIGQVCDEMGVIIVNGVLSRDHVHMFVEIPPHISVSDFVRRAKGRSSRKIQQEFEHIRKRYWGQRFWGRGYFSTTSGNITDDIIDRYLDRHTHKNGFSPSSRSYRRQPVSHSENWFRMSAEAPLSFSVTSRFCWLSPVASNDTSCKVPLIFRTSSPESSPAKSRIRSFPDVPRQHLWPRFEVVI